MSPPPPVAAEPGALIPALPAARATPARLAWSSPAAALLGLALFLGVLLLLAGVRPLSVPDEGRYADAGRWMLVLGDWLTPRINGLPFLHKPPLLHWLLAGSYQVFGAHPLAARLPSMLHAALMVGALFVAARHWFSTAVAWRAAFMLGTSAGVLVAGQYVNHDMLVASWIGVAIWCFAAALLHPGQPHAALALAGFAACALGVLSKGLIGAVLPALVLGVWLSWTRLWPRALRLPWLSGLALLGALALPWFVLIEQRYPGAAAYLFGVQQFERFTGGGFNNEHPWWFYLAVVPLMFFPWVLFVAPAATLGKHRPWHARDERSRRVLQLCWVWLLAILVFFSLPRSKLAGYLLPVLPPLALLAAVGWSRWSAGRARPGRWLAALAALPLTVTLLLSLDVGVNVRAKLSADVARTLACAAGPDDQVYVAGGYAHDLSFNARLRQPMIVVGDWAQHRRSAGDNWARELFESADFEPGGHAYLQAPDALIEAGRRPNGWLLLPGTAALPPDARGWSHVQTGTAWSLYRSGAAPLAHDAALACRDRDRAPAAAPGGDERRAAARATFGAAARLPQRG